MLPYFPAVPSTPEPEGWDAALILQLVNPATGSWTCPTVTKRNRRCEKVVSQERSIKCSLMINAMSVEDAGVIAREHNFVLTELAKTMLCSTHSQGVDSKEKVEGVVMDWRNKIKTSMRQQAQPQSIHMDTSTPLVDYQPTNGLRRRHLDALPQTTPRHRTTAPSVSPMPQRAPPSSSTTIDQDAVDRMMQRFEALTLQNAQLRDQNKKLRGENAQLAEERDAAARDARRARGELKTVERQRDALDEQVDEQFREINALRDREAVQLETISSLRDTLQKTTGAYPRLKQIWMAASVAPKGKV